jgi:Zn-dependent alcohol dehydrogenase
MVTRTAPLEGWQDALAAIRDGEVIRTVLTP